MRWWIRVHRLPLAVVILAIIGGVANVVGDSGLPIVSGSDSSDVPVVALAPALSSAVIVAALAAPWPALAATFGRTTRLLTALWLAVGAVITLVVLLPSVGGEKTNFTHGDLLRNVAVFVAAAAVSGAVRGPQWSWALPAVLTVASFIPSANLHRHWWAVAVWTGTSTAHGAAVLVVAAVLCLPLIFVAHQADRG
jgi:hypothetical protein